MDSWIVYILGKMVGKGGSLKSLINFVKGVAVYTEGTGDLPLKMT